MFLPFVALVAPLQARAASGPEVTPEVLAARADRIVIADVASVRTEGEAPRLRTVTQLAVRESWKGRGPELLEIVQLGGAKGAHATQVVGDARFTAGEQVLVFLRCGEGAECTLVGLGKGRMKLQRGASAADDSVALQEAGVSRRMPVQQLRWRLGLAGGPESAPHPAPGEPVRMLVPSPSGKQQQGEVAR